jgi:RNA polymerase sigma-70 factor (ECF subfamily)
MTSNNSRVGFPETRWTLIEAVSQRNHPFRADALRQLSAGYWQPVYTYLRVNGKSRDEAAEIAQAFFADIVLGKDIFAVADKSRGRLRSLMLTALKHFMIDEHRERLVPQLDHRLRLEDLSEEDALMSGSAKEPEHAFDRRWALSVLHEAMTRCENQFRASGKHEQWQAFEMRDVQPSVSMSQPPPYEQIARDLQMPNVDAAIHAVRMVRKRMLTILRQVAAETAIDRADQQSEYDRIVSLLS